MRIACIATSRVPSLTANSIQVMKVCQALVRLSHELTLWVPGEAPSVSPETLAAHYGLESTPSVRWMARSRWGRNYDFCVRALVEARRWGADLYYVWPLQAAALSSSLGLPTVLEVHDRPAGRLGPLLLGRFLRGRGARRLLPTTYALQAWLSRRYRIDLKAPFSIVAPNGVDLERYASLPSPREARRRLRLPERSTAGYSGHLYAGRGVSLILALAAREPAMSFVLAGGEPAAVESWSARARAMGLRNVTFLGFVANERLPLVQAACDVLLMPYEREISVSGGGDTAETASPMKVFEYMASGRPILSSDLPILREVLSPEEAILLEPGDLEAWQAALRRLSTDRALRAELSGHAAEAARRHSWIARQRRALAGLEIASARAA